MADTTLAPGCGLIASMLAILFAISAFVVAADAASKELKSPYREPIIKYTPGIKGESKLPVCEENMACGLMHSRIFFAPIVFRLCRCADRSECPSDWQDKGDEHIMHINLRAQLKFCGKITKLPTCKPKASTTALTTRTERSSESELQLVTAHCHCPKMRYFDRSDLVVQHLGNTSTSKTQTYKCKPLIKCQTNDFCGHITANYFETYHVCACPQNHMCLMKDRQQFHIIEAMYEGFAFRGHCVPNNANVGFN